MKNIISEIINLKSIISLFVLILILIFKGYFDMKYDLIFDFFLIVSTYYFAKYFLEGRKESKSKELKNVVESLLQIKIVHFVLSEIAYIIELPDLPDETTSEEIYVYPDTVYLFDKNIKRMKIVQEKNKAKINEFFKNIFLKGGKLSIFRDMIDFIDANNQYLDEEIKIQLVIIRDSFTNILRKSEANKTHLFDEYAIIYAESEILKIIGAILSITNSKIFENFF